jgi:hypothetical protein
VLFPVIIAINIYGGTAYRNIRAAIALPKVWFFSTVAQITLQFVGIMTSSVASWRFGRFEKVKEDVV